MTYTIKAIDSTNMSMDDDFEINWKSQNNPLPIPEDDNFNKEANDIYYQK